MATTEDGVYRGPLEELVTWHTSTGFQDQIEGGSQCLIMNREDQQMVITMAAHGPEVIDRVATSI